MHPFDIYLSPPVLSGTELDFLVSELASGWLAPAGPRLSELEERVKSLWHSEVGLSAAAVQSGTAALHLALKAINLKKGDKVLVPTLTFAGGANPVLYENAEIIFIDSLSDDYHPDPDAAETALQKHPNVKAVILPHLFGRCADPEPFIELRKKYSFILIEDAAEALGVRFKGEQVGLQGDISFFSFNGNKIITGSAGGVLMSSQEHYIELARSFARHCKTETDEYLNIGYNYGLSNLCAAVICAQWESLLKRIDIKKNIYSLYQKYLSGSEVLFLLPIPGCEPTHWLTTVHFKDASTADRVRKALLEKRIESRPVWKSLHEMKPYRRFEYFGKNNARQLSETGLCLPSGINLTNEQLFYISEIIRSVL